MSEKKERSSVIKLGGKNKIKRQKKRKRKQNYKKEREQILPQLDIKKKGQTF